MKRSSLAPGAVLLAATITGQTGFAQQGPSPVRMDADKMAGQILRTWDAWRP